MLGREKCWKGSGPGEFLHPWLLAAQLSPESHAYGRDERRPFAAAIFRKEEGHVTLWRQFLHGLVHDSGEAKRHNKHITEGGDREKDQNLPCRHKG